MKKILLVLIGLIIAVPVFYLSAVNVKAASGPDISCGFMDGSMYENVDGSGGYYQTFYPTKNRLDKVVLHLAAFQFLADATMKIVTSDGTELASQTVTVTGAEPVSPADYTYDGFSEITITPGDMYKLVLVRSRGNTLYWYKSSGCGIQGNVYANGTPWTGADYVFTSYGYNASSDTGDSTNNQTVSNAPSSTPSSSIAKPTNAKAEYVSDGSKVKVTWTKSETTDIDGYRIFRSESKTKSFIKIGQVDKKVYEYFDTKISADKTYYYYIRGYKDSTEGLSSNTAEVKIPAIAPAKQKATAATLVPSDETTNWFFYLLLGGTVLFLIVFLVIYELKLKKIWTNQTQFKFKSKLK